MLTILKIVVRFIIYVMILLPLFTNLFGGETLGSILGFVVVAIIASILEIRGLMNKFITTIFGFAGGVMKNSDNSISGTLGQTLAPDEKVVDCPNCGTQVVLSNGRGKCNSCGSDLQS